jgi:DNA-binding protein
VYNILLRWRHLFYVSSPLAFVLQLSETKGRAQIKDIKKTGRAISGMVRVFQTKKKKFINEGQRE